MSSAVTATSFNALTKRSSGLSLEEEVRLAANVQAKQCIVSAKRIAESHIGFVASIARDYSRRYRTIEFDDLFQQGVIGLMKAVQKFCPVTVPGTRFASFSVTFIKGEIIEYVLNNSRTYRIATTKAQRKVFFNLGQHRVEGRSLRADEIKRIAEDLNVKESDIRTMEAKFYYQEAAIDHDDDGLIESQLGCDLYNPESAIGQQHQDAIIARVHTVVNQLDERTREIIYHRVINEEKSTLGELAERFGVSKERVRQLEIRGMAKVKDLMQETAL